jgi:hypothetical protein
MTIKGKRPVRLAKQVFDIAIGEAEDSKRKTCPTSSVMMR